MSLSALTIRQRLNLFMGSAAVLVVAVAFGGLQATWQMRNALAETTTTASAIRAQLEADMMHDALRADAYRAIAVGGGDAEVAASIRKDLAEHASHLREQVGELSALDLPEALKAHVAQVKPALEQYVRATEDIVGLALGGADRSKAAGRLPEFDRAFEDLAEAMTKVSDDIETLSVQADEHAARRLTAALSIVAAVAVLGLIGVTWLGLSAQRRILGPLDQASQVAQRIAQGDLGGSVPAGSRDEIGVLLKAMGDMQLALRGLISEVREGIDQVSTASGEIAGASQDLSVRTERQAAGLQQTTSSLGQFGEGIRGNADAASEADRLAAQASLQAARGGEAVDRVVSTMQDIETASARIAEIVRTVDSIAFQTNILALNAAVEAARAGEQGRGFAVVASEVRQLAQRSGTAAREIAALVTDSVKTVGHGASLVSEAGQTIHGVVSSIDAVTRLVREVSAATAEQSAQVQDLATSLSHIDRDTQQNAAMAEESAGAAESLREQAGRLAEAARGFRL